MKIYLGTDHAGFDLKEQIKSFLKENGYNIEDCGAYTFDKSDDYPDFISKVGEAVSKDLQNSKGIILGGSGQAEMMLANKYKNIRCALFYGSVPPIAEIDSMGTKSNDPYEIIKLTRLHNDSNILSLGARFLRLEEAIEAVKIWIETPFSNDERHIRRLNKIISIEDKS